MPSPNETVGNVLEMSPNGNAAGVSASGAGRSGPPRAAETQGEYNPWSKKVTKNQSVSRVKNTSKTHQHTHKQKTHAKKKTRVTFACSSMRCPHAARAHRCFRDISEVGWRDDDHGTLKPAVAALLSAPAATEALNDDGG